jgi:hypothetical protein
MQARMARVRGDAELWAAAAAGTLPGAEPAQAAGTSGRQT